MPERMRVASVTRRLTVAGDETRLLNTAVAYDHHDVEQVVIVISPTDDERDHWVGSMRERYRESGVEVVELNLELGGLRHAFNVVRAINRLVREFRLRHIDVVDARLGTPTALGLVAANLANVPVVVSTAYYTSFWSLPLKYFVGQACLAFMDALISDAQATLDDFEQWRWSRHAELVLIQNGVPPARSGMSREEARTALGLPVDSDVVVIGQISRIIPRKGFETFLQAARLVLDERPNTMFLGVGFVAEDQHFLSSLNDLAESLDIAHRVRLLSYPGPIGDVYAAIDIFAHLSTLDSSPTAIHENMSVGRPAVITALPGNLEIVEDRVTALLVPPASPERAAAAMLELIRDSSLANRLGAAARQYYEERHQPEVMAAAHEALFRRLLQAKRRRG